ncbi:unnamed protein product, partial [Medioppia subpectinata]
KDSFTSLTHLVVLDLSKNRLTELPQSFGDLNRLTRLDLYDNQLKTLPLSFAQLSRLKWLDLKSNPLESQLAKYAGDCANQRQCEICAINCIRFVKNERLRIETENRINEQKLREKQEYERQLNEKNKKEKEKKKAKNTRRKDNRKAQQLADNNSENDSETKDNDSDAKSRKKGSNSGNKSFCGFLFRFLFGLILVSLTLFMGISIGLHLQNGHELQTVDDVKNAFADCAQRIANYKHFTKDVSILITNIVNHLKHFRHTFFDTKPNVTKT